MKTFVAFFVLFMAFGISFTATADTYPTSDVFEYPEIISEECTEETITPSQGTGIFKDWYLTMSDLKAYGARGKVYMNDIDFTVNISNTTTTMCRYEYDNGTTEVYSRTTYDGAIVGKDDGLISVSTYTDDVTGQLEVDVTLELPDQFGDTIIVFGTLYMTQYGLTGFTEGYLPTRDGSSIKMFGDMDITEVGRKG